MKAHTTLNLDMETVKAASAVLGTSGTGETVRAALEEVVRAHRRTRLLDVTVDLTLDDLRAMRRTGRVPAP